MTTIITVLMYSGKPNPSWELTPEQSEKLKSILADKKEVTLEMSANSAGLLGYTGFKIESYDLSLPSKAYCFDGIIDLVDQKTLNFVDKDSNLESFLLESAGQSLNEEELSYLIQFFDCDEDEKLNYTEFLSLVLPCDNAKL